ncbi:MAG: hypothetical protein HeimC2_01020 [Candidatus Heimdallarchaeota archaeon LC_2]|nr:MAG: hypothetical protein HeimC2_01020 [Candidatus Heimdallarchaeota archaeon LC_2]
MSTKTEQTEHSGHDINMEKQYLQVFIVLAVLTVIEVAIGSLDTSASKAAILILFAVVKASLVAAIFMHVKYDRNPKIIVIFTFIVPLIGALILGSVIYADYRV